MKVDINKIEPKKDIDEIGIKRLPAKNATTAKAAAQFISMGLDLLRNIPAPVKDSTTGNTIIKMPEAELIGKICSGSLLFAQGLELYIKLIFIVENIKESGFKQHAIFDKFHLIKDLSPIKENIEIYVPKSSKSKIKTAEEVVKMAEESFMTARYIGLRKENLNPINPLNAAGLLLALVFSYEGFEQVYIANSLGIKISDPSGNPINQQFTIIKNENEG